MREKFILQPGKICTFDKDNKLKKDINSVIFVEIVEEVKTGKLFGPRQFKVIGAGDDKIKLPDPVVVPETLLSPEGMAVIRYPEDIPVINNKDLWALNIVIDFITSPQNNFTDNSDKDKSVIGRLYALREKFKYYLKSNEV